MSGQELDRRYGSAVRRYLSALSRGDTDRLVGLFTSDGEVISPLLGRMSASTFFTELARSTRVSDLRIIDLLTSTTDQRRVGAYFRYRWTLRTGAVADFECCDLFEFAEPEDDTSEPLIRLMTIVYDTAPVRAILQADGDIASPTAPAPMLGGEGQVRQSNPPRAS